ncbi:hypothetical protein [Tessaracoccus sp. ZS01]|uniref:hypothetical protein n=1 Tax=Tessaracoccus sp. ZS01 TaxID=1906324 RepID=UPI00117E6196|nr:hypothetical protein [Tessaracoccus sp. ZS01]
MPTLHRALALLGACALSLAAFVTPAQATDVLPSTVSGNPSCEDLGYDFGYKPAGENVPGTYTVMPGFTITFSADSELHSIDWSSTYGPAAVLLKAGVMTNVYEYDGTVTSDTGLQTPTNTGGNQAALSHIEFCFTLEPVVTKTAVPSFERAYTWTIDKTVVPTSLTLEKGATAMVDYTVVLANSSVDSDWAVSGSVTIVNPWPVDADIVSITDHLADNSAVTLTCPSDTVLDAGETIVCTYDHALAGAVSGTNTAVVVVDYGFGDKTVSDDAAYTFGDPSTVTDECVEVTDSLQGLLDDELCDPFTFMYQRQVGPYNAAGTYYVDNTATFVTNDTGTTGDDDAQVVITVPEDSSVCTLTLGYWKTHSHSGPAAHYDDGWSNVGALEENTMFYSSGQTWLQVFNTPPAGNAYYILAQQYMAAWLNVHDGADSTAAVDSALAQADTLFSSLSGTTLTRQQTTLAKQLAGTLASYNEGLIGPGHCDAPLS